MGTSPTRWPGATAALFMLLCTLLANCDLPAQVVRIGGLTQLGSETEQRHRLQQLIDSSSSANWMARSASTLAGADQNSARFRVTLLAPEVLYISNSALPFSLNDGPLWAGRGANVMYTGGASLEYRWFHVIIAPQFSESENRAFQVIPTSQDSANARNVWANPFHPASSSVDFPLRFGDGRLRRTEAGQSSLTVKVPRAAFGIGTENMWWGPGIQNAILLSNSAPGFPHAFVRTRDGITSRAGRFDAQWVLGELRESDYFDDDSTNNVRTLNGLIVEWTPTISGGLHLGIARTVFAPAKKGHVRFSQAFDAFKSVGNPNTSETDTVKRARPDQITSLFARWVVPAAHVESYVEWARFEQPLSLRDLMEFPGHSQGYTVGLQWARPFESNNTFRLAAEVTYLEPDASIRLRPVATTYTSRPVVQGYTNRGQSLGAAIGPGSSSQWLSADVFGAKYRIGLSTSRIRWDNATLWDPIIPEVKNEDVTVLGAVHVSATWRGARVALDYTHAVRLDYLYQDKVPDLTTGEHTGVDIRNRTLSITVSSAIGR